MKRSPVLCAIALAALLLVPAAFAAAQYDFSSATDDLEQAASALSSIFGPNLGGMSYLGEPIGYSIIPHVSFGISGGAVLIPLENIDLGTSLSGDLTGLESLAVFAIPAVGAHAKFTIKKKLEMGVKVAGIPQVEYGDGDFAVDNLIIGGKVRYNLVGFKLPLLKGGVSVGALYEYMKGSIMFAQSDSFPVDLDSDGTPEGTFDADAALNTAWHSSTVGAETQANAQVLFLNLFLGTRISKTFGEATTSMNGTGILTDNPSNPVDVVEDTDTIAISEVSQPSGFDPYVFGGLEIKILGLVIAGKGTYNITNGNYILESGLRLQF